MLYATALQPGTKRRAHRRLLIVLFDPSKDCVCLFQHLAALGAIHNPVHRSLLEERPSEGREVFVSRLGE